MMQIVAGRVRPENPLTKRQALILQLLSEGKSSREIAELLFISIHTVNCHKYNIKRKLNLKKTADLIRYALQKGHTFSDGS
jgi:two-component system nitrate/nitrite response regulator NarL